LLDVRQSKEYESEHLPGAKRIPLPDLRLRIDELNADISTIVYGAIGGRSRIASQREGGLTTDAYLGLYQPDLAIPLEVISRAMAIEAPVLDLYQRVAAMTIR
jgi:hypothetical protein